MKKHHTYYYLTKEDAPCHRFSVHCSLSDNVVKHYKWDGISQEITTCGGSFGMSHGHPREQIPLPDTVSHLAPQLKQSFKTKYDTNWCNEDNYEIWIFYNGYYASKRIECLIVLNQYARHKCEQTEKWSPYMQPNGWQYCYHETINIGINPESGYAQLDSHFWSISSCSTLSITLPVPSRIIDFCSTIPTVDSEGNFLKDDFQGKLFDYWKNLPLVEILLENRILSLQQYNEKYNLVRDIPLDIFKPDVCEWQIALKDITATENELIHLLDFNELFQVDPEEWARKTKRKQVGIARAFLRSNSEVAKMFDRLVLSQDKKFSSSWDALKALDPAFDYPIYQIPIPGSLDHEEFYSLSKITPENMTIIENFVPWIQSVIKLSQN